MGLFKNSVQFRVGLNRLFLIFLFLFSVNTQAQTEAKKHLDDFQPDKTYAILISGDDELCQYQLSIKSQYQVIQDLKVPKENIIVVAKTSCYPDLNDFDQDGVSDINSNPTYHSLDEAFKQVGKRMPSDGQIIVSIGAHGIFKNTPEKGILDYCIELSEDENLMPAKKINELIETNLNPNIEKIILVDTCFSGNILDSCANLNRIILTSADRDSYSYIGAGGTFFGKAICSSLRNEESDSNGDGKVSMKEVFEASKNKQRLKVDVDKLRDTWEFPPNIVIGEGPVLLENNPQFWASEGSDFTICHPQPKSTIVKDVQGKMAVMKEVEQRYFHPGDINGNNKIDNEDIEGMTDFHWHFRSLTPREAFILDMDQDGDVDTEDAALMIKKKGKILPIEEIKKDSTMPKEKRKALVLHKTAEAALKSSLNDIKTYPIDNNIQKNSTDKNKRHFQGLMDEFEMSLKNALANGFLKENAHEKLIKQLQNAKP